MFREIIAELKKLYAFWSAITLLINYLIFISNVDPNSPNYMFEILGYLILSQVESAVFTALTAPRVKFLRDLGLPL